MWKKKTTITKPTAKLVKILVLLLLATEIIECKIVEKKENENNDNEKNVYGKNIKIITISYSRPNKTSGILNDEKYNLLLLKE